MKIYVADIEGISDIESAASLLDNNRQQQLAGIRGEEDRKRCIAAGLLMRKMIEDMGSNDEICVGTHGKPFLKDSDYHFNISHSGRYAVLCYCKEECGIDVQRKREFRDSLIKRFLTKEETDMVASEMEKKQSIVNRLWTVKEAYIKMTGNGLSQDMRTIKVKLENNTVVDSESGVKMASFKEFNIDDEYCMSICAGSMISDCNPEFIRW